MHRFVDSLRGHSAVEPSPGIAKASETTVVTSEELMNCIAESSSLPRADRIAAGRALFASLGVAKLEMPSSIALAEINRLLETVERTIEAFPPDDPVTSGFEDWLYGSLGRDGYPDTLAADLAHLFITLEFLYQRLSALCFGSPPMQRSRTLAQLWALKFDLKELVRRYSSELEKQLSTVVPRRAASMRD